MASSLLDMLSSAGALVSVWWMLRAIVRPATAAAAALLLGVAPSSGATVRWPANYTAIMLVGAFLLGVAYRGRFCPEPWQPFAAAGVFALGTGYRQDIGTLWLAGFRRDPLAAPLETGHAAGLLFTMLNLAWLSAMLYDVGGWSRYRAAQRGICLPSAAISIRSGTWALSTRPCDTRSSSGWLWSGRSARHSCSFPADHAAPQTRSRCFPRRLDRYLGRARRWARTSWCSSEVPVGAFIMFRP